MTNEQLLVEIGRMMGKAIHEAIQESEERMKVEIRTLSQKFDDMEKHVNVEIGQLSQKFDDMEKRIADVRDSVEDLRGTVHQVLEESEKMALQIASSLESH